jgi:hypothetical protein
MDNGTAKRPNNRCTGCDCQFFDKSYGGGDPVWVCDNCGKESARRVVRRRTNKLIALDLWTAIVAEWEPTDDALDRLVTEGRAKSGVLFRSRVWDYNLQQLQEIESPTRWDIQYHARSAREALAEAEALVKRIEVLAD